MKKCFVETVNVNWKEEKFQGTSQLDAGGLLGTFDSLTQKDEGEISSTLSLVPSFEIEFEDIWGKNLPATQHLFFLKKEDLTNQQIQDKSGANNNWPVFKPKSFSTTVYGKTETKALQVFISRAFSGSGYQPTTGSTYFRRYQRPQLDRFSATHLLPTCQWHPRRVPEVRGCGSR
jgi:hypothetical protein